MKGWFEKPSEGIEHDRCGLRIEGPMEARSSDEAWALLPASGEGWVALTAEVRRFEPGHRDGLLLHAEVADGKRTVVLRHEEGVWRAWSWQEVEGDDHRVVRQRYCCSAHKDAPDMKYATYWSQQDDAGVHVWAPVGSRFCGWED